ncbi:isocitrate lyase/phosphoenolpyruvate mutase family protein [Hymenobacter sp. 15J16-1T3B]|uniref:isocitrate lyase/PEP mutase family protein n=1 Tax=Hymenobacter sp. 15J16-1T3B TaxID=2886941 RepID=UPI001D10777B|nr:isocitrate lyase/phosphoenolpyruvate mutase family protein [Hymenobacter sp. 15J16-1T3B]MCC3157085.1 isocitrate lyase/phosphoenolpyruvate mutase family protein [Hymenobacter sp. 15J16-1T3B]
MVTPYQRFRALHYQRSPLVLPTIWDARSAAVCQAQGSAAVGTSSAAMASVLGYADGEQLPFAELRYLVGRICAGATVPVSVDMEGGYSREPAQILEHIRELAALGVAGINLEDSVAAPGRRELLAPEAFAATLAAVRAGLTAAGVDVFLNVRTDTYLLPGPQPLAATLHRLRLYEAAGADGLFVPGLTELAAIQRLCQATSLPVNLMALPALPDFAALAAAGVRRLSMGNFLLEALSQRQQQLSQQISNDQSFCALFA